MDAKVMKIIESDREPVYTLSEYSRKLSKSDQDRFWDSIKHLAITGGMRQRRIALWLISNENRNLQIEMIDGLIKSVSPEIHSILLPPILRMIKNLNRLDMIPYCQNALTYASSRNDVETSVMAFRTLLLMNWESAYEHIVSVIRSSDVKTIVDNFAFFKSTHDLANWEILLGTLSKSDRDLIYSLDKEINLRCRDHYQKLY